MTDIDQGTLATLAAERAQLQEQAEQIRQALEVNKAAILAATDGPDTYAAGALTIEVTQASRLDLAAIAAAYPVTEHPQLYKLTPDTKAVRRHITEADLDTYTIRSAPSVRLK